MGNKHSNLPLKVIFSYIVLAALVVSVGWFLYSENVFYNTVENKSAAENNVVLRFSKLFSNVYKTESLARKTIQTNSETDFKMYIQHTDSLQSKIDSLKETVSNKYQVKLLDSVTLSLKEKTRNIRKLKTIKSKTADEASVTNAIQELTQLEFSLRKLQLEDFTKNPEQLDAYQRKVLQNYVDYLNKNIPDDSTNTLTKKATDSILAASKRLLNKVKLETEKKKESLSLEENKLLRNEILISEQLRKVLRVIENELIVASVQNNFEKEKSLKKINQIVTYAAGVGLLLTVIFSLLITSDFSKSQSYKKQLEVANFKTQNLLKSREQLISTVSHDLKTPLSTIVGYAELLSQADLSKKQRYYTHNIKSATEYITRLVQDLLDFSQIEAGKITLNEAPFSLSKTIWEVVQNVQSVYLSKDLSLQVKIDDRLDALIVGDVFRVKQVLMNVVGNAFKFTREGYVRITAEVSNDLKKVLIRITDSGIGIEQHSQELVFEEFTQANESIEKEFGGTGLGLAISKKMAKLLGGDLYLLNSSSSGSSFEFCLPLRFNPVAENQVQNLYVPRMQNQTILVVDDDKDLLKLTTEVLKKHHHVVGFSNPALVIDYVKEMPFDLLMTDIQMPEIDGFGLVKILKNTKNSTFENQPLLAITGRTDLDDAVYREAGFCAVLKKPFHPNLLLKTIDALLNQMAVSFSEEEKNDESVANAAFSLDSLRLFLANDAQEVNRVLQSFIESTRANLSVLQKAMALNEVQTIQQTAHKMAPMFKQIQANAIAVILTGLESNKYNQSEWGELFSLLETEIKYLFDDLEKIIHSTGD
ncbi:hybrid sensor histidine kinase/response regulator [Flavobacterium sp. UMI-01]|uniref:hybrid sensor histidine kinase/response regulator n=1 Tax=Flavobacterium sp. UMI-01 TaxID=1441053 RepID=UPI001C7DD6D1|nr:ATP-binding protein [Flavobacterium sp. UMI-01]GIZ07927.1 hybrid sensor histidine kinase/response regulator [Flavobacterium sp. UMI-01]